MLRQLLSLLITALLLLGLARIIDMSRVVTLLRGISPPLLALAVAATAVNVLVSSVRYRLILRAITGANNSLKDIFQINLLSIFAAHFLPVAVAADGLRMTLASFRFRLQAGSAVESILADRLVAAAGLCACAILALPLQAALGVELAVLALQLAATIAVLGITVLLLWSASRRELPRWNWPRKLAVLTRGVARHFARCMDLRTQFLLAFASTLTFAGTLWLLGAGMRMRLSVVEVLAFAPAIYLSQVMPFVYFGFGAREAAAVFFCQRAVPLTQRQRFRSASPLDSVTC